MAKAKAKVTTKIKKKFWFPILAPKVFNNQSLGEIYLVESGSAVGRVFWHPMKELTGSMRDQNVYLYFKIKKSPSNNLETDIVGYKLTPNSLKKMVRRNNDRCDDSFVLETSDGKKIRIKTLFLTAHQTKNSVDTRLRKAMVEKLTADIKKINFGNLIDKLISNKLQIETKKFLTKLYPVKAFVVKYMVLEKEDLAGHETVEEKPKPVKEAVEKAETQAVEKTVEKVVEKVEKVPEEKAEAAQGGKPPVSRKGTAEELVEGKEEVKEEKKE